MADLSDMFFGANGPVNETGTTAVTGLFYMVDILLPTTFTVFTEVGASGDPLTGVEWPAGTKFYNPKGITAITQTSGGAFRAYNL